VADAEEVVEGCDGEDDGVASGVGRGHADDGEE
jgi:hypothetical protein